MVMLLHHEQNRTRGTQPWHSPIAKAASAVHLAPSSWQRSAQNGSFTSQRGHLSHSDLLTRKPGRSEHLRTCPTPPIRVELPERVLLLCSTVHYENRCARGVSTRYITSGVHSIADDLITGEYHENMVGLKKVQAGTDLVPAKARKKKAKAQAKVKEEHEEWGGISAE
ncbi:hypothetical protein NUW54_g3019 [Trametes sanguinea]|uniref:Uncharacterized protein n=1 Tax=Trametes sanguinea TaxID=158606 RepID=A0ACC1Q5K4_9APHY|nr:hypothetical protein NUW54_g3019 [Trametes sanguinea]